MQKITPCLWFGGNAQEAIDLYTSVFKDARVTNKNYYGKGAPLPEGALLTATLQLLGQEFLLLNATPGFPYNYSVSFVINCADQAEVDYYWEHLSAGGGAPEQCGWLKDKFGLSWQIVPTELPALMSGPDKDQNNRVMAALMQMQKIEIAALKAAAEGA